MSDKIPKSEGAPVESSIDEKHEIQGIKDRIRQFASKQKPRKTWGAEPKKKRKSKRFWGGAALVVGILLSVLGVDIDSAFLADGMQFRDIENIMMIVGALVMKWGEHTATQPLRTVTDSLRSLINRMI